MEEIPEDNMPLHSDTTSEEIEEPKKEEIVAEPTQSETDKLRERLPLPSLHKVANSYRLPIPLKCHPKEADNDKKPLRMKDPRSFMVNIFIGGKETTRVMLDLGVSINIMTYSVYL